MWARKKSSKKLRENWKHILWSPPAVQFNRRHQNLEKPSTVLVTDLCMQIPWWKSVTTLPRKEPGPHYRNSHIGRLPEAAKDDVHVIWLDKETSPVRKRTAPAKTKATLPMKFTYYTLVWRVLQEQFQKHTQSEFTRPQQNQSVCGHGPRRQLAALLPKILDKWGEDLAKVTQPTDRVNSMVVSRWGEKICICLDPTVPSAQWKKL